jgi:hypothetical protein
MYYFMYSLFFFILSSTCFGCYLHPSSGSTTAAYSHRCVYVVCPRSKCTDFLFNYLLDLPEITYGFGMLVHWSRYWLGHPHTFSTVVLLRMGALAPETCRAKNKEYIKSTSSWTYNLLKPTGYGMHQQVEYFNNCLLCPHCIYVICICLTCATYIKKN